MRKIILLLFISLFTSCYRTTKVEVEKPKVAEIDLLIKAIQKHESNNVTDTVSRYSSATGVLQILDCALEDANRISGKNYSYDDRLDSLKSVEIFKIIQKHYNPKLNKKKAIHLWRWGCGNMNKHEEDCYYKAVMLEFNKLKSNENKMEIINDSNFCHYPDNTEVQRRYKLGHPSKFSRSTVYTDVSIY